MRCMCSCRHGMLRRHAVSAIYKKAARRPCSGVQVCDDRRPVSVRQTTSASRVAKGAQGSTHPAAAVQNGERGRGPASAALHVPGRVVIPDVRVVHRLH